MADDNKIIAELVVTGIDKAKAEFGIIVQESDKVVTNVEQIGTASTQAVAESTKSFTTYKSQLKSMREEITSLTLDLADMKDAGKQGTKEFTDLEKKIVDLTKKAGHLKDAIGDVNQTTRDAGSDTRGLDRAIRVVGSATAAFQVFEGAATLAGKGNEDLQKALVKLNAVMAITQGLQQIQNELTKNDSVFKGAAAKATAFYNIVVGESTGVLKAFRIALAATGIGLAIVGIAALVENWDKLKSIIGLSTYDLDKFNASLAENERFNEGISKSRQRDILEMKKKGSTEAEIQKATIKFAEEEYNAGVEQLNLLSKQRDEAYGNKEAIKKIDEEIAKQQDKNFAADMKKGQAEIALQQALKQEEAKKLEEYKKTEAYKRKVALEEAVKLLQEFKKIDALTKIYKQGTSQGPSKYDLLMSQLGYPKEEDLPKLREEAKSKANAAALELMKATKEAMDQQAAAATAPMTNVQNLFFQFFGLDADNFKNQLDYRFAAAQAFYSKIQQLANKTQDIIKNATQIRADREIAALEDKKKKGIISEKQYQRELNKIKNAQAQKDHRAAVINAFMMIPQAVLSAYVGTPGNFVVKGIAAGIAGAFATAQAALVAASPIPKFRQGGSVAKRLGLIRGKAHEQGGVPIEVEGNEFVMSKRAVQKYGVDFMDRVNNLKVSPVITMASKLDKANKTDYKLYEHLATMGSYMKQDYKSNERGNDYLRQLVESSKYNKRTYV